MHLSLLVRRMAMATASALGLFAVAAPPAGACGANYPGASGQVQPGISPIMGGGVPKCDPSLSFDRVPTPYLWNDDHGTPTDRSDDVDYPLVANENFRTCNFENSVTAPNRTVTWHCSADSTSGEANWRMDAILGTGDTAHRVMRYRKCAANSKITDLFDAPSVVDEVHPQNTLLWHLHLHTPSNDMCPPEYAWVGHVQIASK